MLKISSIPAGIHVRQKPVFRSETDPKQISVTDLVMEILNDKGLSPLDKERQIGMLLRTNPMAGAKIIVYFCDQMKRLHYVNNELRKQQTSTEK